MVTSAKQITTLTDVCNHATAALDISAVWMFHSPVDDHAAFEAAAAVYEALFFVFGGKVLAADELYEKHCDVGVYLIHGLTPRMRSGDIAGLRSFLRKHSTSLHLLVGSVGRKDPLPSALDDLLFDQLQVHPHSVFTLSSVTETVLLHKTRVMEV